MNSGSTALWLGRYTSPLPVRSRGAFHMVSVAQENRRSLVIVGAPSAQREQVRDALDSVARVHAVLDHPRIPRLVLRGEHDGIPFVELACDATVDGHDFLRLLAEARLKLPYGQGDAMFTLVRETMEAAHATADPVTGGPICLGQLSHANLVFSPSGWMWVVGFGFNFPVHQESGSPEGVAPVFQAPEVLAGDPASPIGDYVAVLLAARSLTSFCDISDISRRVLLASVSKSNTELYEGVRYFESRFISEAPARRPTIAEGVARSSRVREILGTAVDAEGLARTIVELLDETTTSDEAGRIVIASDGSTIELPSGTRHVLGRAHKQILRVLLQAHRKDPERRLDVWDLLEAGWPGEDPIREAGANRVYVAIARLRSLNLREVIEQSDGGYRLKPGSPFRIAGLFG